ncbi:MAG: 1-acyl-sn-glycerol-3-phosphate acyltransferase [Phormidesmis sp.]
MSFATNRVQPALEFIPPCYSPLLKRSIQLVMPAWTAWQTDLAGVETHNVETLAKLYHEFDGGKTRLLLAFRHPTAVDPFVLSHLLWRALPQAAREMDLPLKQTHAHFLYDRGIPLWAGRYLGWVFSRLGGVPIQRGKLDLVALKMARRLLAEGHFPLAAAPEGGNNGHNEIMSPLEPGIAQLTFWCAEDMQAKGQNTSVIILPVGIQYRYLEAPWQSLVSLMDRMEAECGLEATGNLDLYGRLYQLAAHMLTLMEGYYQTCYGVTFRSENGSAAELDPNEQLAERLSMLMDKSLQVAEDYFGVRPKGSLIDRCRKLEQAGWNRIFREDKQTLSPVDLGLANRVAEEADLRMWHMRLVESFVAVTGHYVKEKPSADRFAETLLLLRNMIEKIKGRPLGRISGHDSRLTSLGAQRAIATIGEPIEVTERLADYQQHRRGAIASLTTDLQKAMESLILAT